MPVQSLLRTLIITLVVRFAARTLVRLLPGIVIATLLLLALAQVFVAHAEGGTSSTVVLATLAPAIPPTPASPVARGVFYRSTTALTIPKEWPDGTRIMVGGGPDGRGETKVDDVAFLVITTADRPPQRVELSFQRVDGDGVLAWAPVDLTGQLGRGSVTLELQLEDLHPPVAWSSSPIVLVAELPAMEASTGESEPTPQAAAPEAAPVDAPGSDPIDIGQVATQHGLVAVAFALVLIVVMAVFAVVRRRVEQAAFDGSFKREAGIHSL